MLEVGLMKYTVDVGGRSIDVELVYQEANIRATLGNRSEPIELHRLSKSEGLHALVYGNFRATFWLTRQEEQYYNIQWKGRVYPVKVGTSAVRELRHYLRRPGEARAGEEIVKAHMPGLIVKIAIHKGQLVKKGTGLLVIDAMKMENEIRSPCDGIVKEVAVEVGHEVSRGQVLCVIGPNHAEVKARA